MDMRRQLMSKHAGFKSHSKQRWSINNRHENGVGEKNLRFLVHIATAIELVRSTVVIFCDCYYFRKCQNLYIKMPRNF
jgi:hypothetical protein